MGGPAVALWLLDCDECSERENVVIRKRKIQDKLNPFELSDRMFNKLFRISKDGAQFLLRELGPHMPQPIRKTKIPCITTILCALHSFGLGSYQKGAGRNFYFALSQPAVSRAVNSVINDVLVHLGHWIHFPETDTEVDLAKAKFAAKDMPDVIGSVGATQVAIIKPKMDEQAFANCESYHSLNVEIVCDGDMRIIDCDANSPGSFPNSHVWEKNVSSRLHMETKYREGQQNTYLIGDFSYPIQPWLLTPYVNPPADSAEQRFNEAFLRAQGVVHQTIGLLKARFRCLLKQNELRYSPEKTSKIIYVCAILHNIALHYNSEIFVPEFDDSDVSFPTAHDLPVDYLQEGGKSARYAYTAAHF